MELSEHRFLRSRSDALVSIAEAVSTGEGAHDWARVDLSLLFSDEAVVHSDAESAIRKLSTAESVRNISVFLPLLFTWLGIASATFAYGRLIDEHPIAARQPFIQLWEQRFAIDGLTGPPPWWVPSFSMVALADFLAILLVIGLSVWVAKAKYRLEVKVVEEETEVQNQLAGAIGDAAVILARRSLASPTNFNETMNRVADQMVALQDRTSATAKSAQRSLDRGSELLTGLDKITGRVAEAAEEIAAALKAVEPVLQGTRMELQDVAQAERKLADQVASGLQGFSTTHSLLSASSQALSDSTARIDASFNAGLQAATSMNESAQQTSAQLSRAASELGKLEGVAVPLGKALDSLESTVHTVPKAAGELGTSAEKLDRSAGELAALSREISQLPTLLRGVTQQLQATAAAQHQILEAMGVVAVPRRRRWPFGRRGSRRSRKG